MPNYLALTDKETGKRHENRGLIEVDEKMCKAFGVPCDDKQFYLGWVDWDILYMKNDWDEISKFYRSLDVDKDYLDSRLKVIDWLSKHYSLDGYYCPR